MKVFVEFVGSVFFVDFGLAQNPYMPTTHKFKIQKTSKLHYEKYKK